MHDRHETGEPPPDVGKGHETRDISTRVVVVFGASLFVGAVIIHVVIWLLYAQFQRAAANAYPREYPMAHVGAPALPPEPRLQTQPREELQRMRAEEMRVLESYGWVDPQRGVVHIPIEQAMDMVVRQGLPFRAGAAPYAPQAMPDKSNSGRGTAPRGR
jgi:hypothetical protein